MFVAPFRPDVDYYHLSIDGSTATVGLCYFTVKDKKMVVEDCKLLDVTKQNEKYEHFSTRYDDLTVRLIRLSDLFDEYLKTHRVTSPIYYESHFINARRPTSVIPLVRFSQIVYESAIKYGLTVETVAPQQMKKSINVTGKLSKADKDKVYLAIKKLVLSGEIILNKHIKLDELSEHEIDAIGIGYTGIKLTYP